ncbi:MAG: electron transfer flavoprotein subunit alpha/FixB family protein [Balneolaceae bacterium]|nr:electron transfer flavoprotein subunit alpha/FixB family protein [Balneolaceae bacterium]
MSTLLTYVAISDGKIKRSSLEVLSHCKSIADAGGFSCEAVIIDENASSFTDDVQKYGASKIYTVSGDAFSQHQNGSLLKALTKVNESVSPALIAFASTESTKDVLGALAAQLKAGVVADVSSFNFDGSKVSAQRPMMAAKIMGNVDVTGNPILVSVRSGSYDLNENPSTAEVVSLDVSVDSDDLRATLREIISATGDTIDLNEADAIVAAGRGVKDEEAKNLISELASVLNAGIGASRALTESGVYDPSLQIGQTGKVVSPQLYIAVGISGAIQHVAGMANSKVIVAINKDADAPIFEVADYGIVGDLYKVLPPFIEEIKKIKN